MSTKITVIESDSAYLWFYPEHGIVHHQFLKPLTGDTFQRVLLAGLRLLNEHHAQKWLSDDRGNPLLSADDSAWSQDYWLPRAREAGWKYWAVVLPDKARGQVVMRRLMSFVGEESGVILDVFPDPDSALQWLMKQPHDAN
jgi:hypothetical protein